MEMRIQNKLAAMSLAVSLITLVFSSASDAASVASQSALHQGASNRVTTPIARVKQTQRSGAWVLQCVGRSPAWKIEILPKSLRGKVNGETVGLPIMSKRQAHGRYNRVALKTVIKGANRWNRLDLTLSFTKSCRSSVTGKLMSFKAKGSFNDTDFSGCCRAVRL